jgi:hypothetical protein
VDQDCLDKETEANVRAIPWAAELIRLHATTLTQATHNSGNCENLAVICVVSKFYNAASISNACFQILFVCHYLGRHENIIFEMFICPVQKQIIISSLNL